MQEHETIFMAHRHTDKGKTETGITEEGEQNVREKTRTEFLKTIEESEPGSVVIMGGASDLIRTKSTSRVAGQELKEQLKDREDEYLVLDESDINSLNPDKAEGSTLKKLSELVAANPDKKVVLNYPLYLKELSLVKKEATAVEHKPEWKEGKEEKASAYMTELLRRNNKNELESVKDWVRNQGKITLEDGTVLEGPNPNEVVQEYLRSFKRLQKTAGKLFPDRPLVIQETGHSWEIDILIAYLANGGKLDEEAVEKIAKSAGEEGSIISSFESPVIKVSDKEANLTYRDKTYSINKQEFGEIQKAE